MLTKHEVLMNTREKYFENIIPNINRKTIALNCKIIWKLRNKFGVIFYYFISLLSHDECNHDLFIHMLYYTDVINYYNENQEVIH